MRWLQSWLRRTALALLIALLALATLTARAVERGEAAMAESDAAFNRGQVRDAATHARRAAVSYAPGAPHVRAAYERLQAIGVGAEVAGEPEVAMFAWRAMRSAALETRHVALTHHEELERANRELARLEVAVQNPGTERELLREQKIAWQSLSRPVGVRLWWVAVLGFGFVSAAAGLTWVMLRGVRPDGALSTSAARWGGLLTLIGAACWTWAVVTA